jgi:predicted kinase
MPAPTVTMTIGLPGSGKTTWARARQVEDPELVLVCKDELRAMLHAGRHTKGNERQVLAVRDAVVVDSVARGRSVIVHDTNLHPRHREELGALAAAHGASFAVEDFTGVDIDVCIARDAGRPAPVGERVIRTMWRDFLWVPPVPAPAPADAREAVICDLDGTLALIGDRSPYDRTGACADDTLNGPVAHLVSTEAARGTAIVVMSGREDIVRAATVDWLDRHGVPWDLLLMRSTDDRRKDSVVKKELFDEHVAGRYRVLYVVDDRAQVVRMWRETLGLFVLDVNQTGEVF